MQDSLELRLQPDASRYTWGSFLDDVAARHGDKDAIRFEGVGISYASLRMQARELAKRLVDAGVTKGTRVAVHMANRPEFIVASFATALLGAVLVPVNTFATLPEREYILRHSDAAVLLFARKLLKQDFLADLQTLLPPAGPIRCKKLPNLRRAICLGLAHADGVVESWAEFLAAPTTCSDSLLDAISAQVTPSDEGMIIYTSGSTSTPKGVLHLQRAPTIMSWRFADELRYTEQDRIWTAYPFFWSAGIAMAIGACLGSGAVLVLQEVFEPAAALRCFVSENVTGLQAWPHQEKAMAEHPLARELTLPRMSKLDFVSPMAPLVGIERDEWGIFGSYGMTETFTLVANLPADAPAQLRKDTSGRPLPGTRIRIVDGEIAVKGVSLMRGYYKVVPESCFDADGFFRTQDGGSLDADGFLHWTGRLSNIIKTGGANVSPVEIEETLASLPGVRASFVFGAPHATLGEAIVVGVVPSEAALREADVQDFLRSRLAAYKRPKAVLFFDEAELELTGSQKVSLSKMAAKGLARLRSAQIEIDGVRYGEATA